MRGIPETVFCRILMFMWSFWLEFVWLGCGSFYVIGLLFVWVLVTRAFLIWVHIRALDS